MEQVQAASYTIRFKHMWCRRTVVLTTNSASKANRSRIRNILCDRAVRMVCMQGEVTHRKKIAPAGGNNPSVQEEIHTKLRM